MKNEPTTRHGHRARVLGLVALTAGIGSILATNPTAQAQGRRTAKDGSGALERVCKKMALTPNISPYALYDLDAAPMREEMHTVTFTWLTSGYFPLRKTPRAHALIVDQVKGVAGQKFNTSKHISHILDPKVEQVARAIEGTLEHTFTPADRELKPRHVIVKKGDPLYVYAYASEGDVLVGVRNRHDGQLVLYYGGAKQRPDPKNPYEVEWWVQTQGHGEVTGWLRFDPRHMSAKLEELELDD